MGGPINPRGAQVPTGDITSVVAGDGLSGGGSAGAVSLALDVNELTVATAVAADYIAIEDIGDNSTKKALISDIVSLGDITAIVTAAASGLSGGATSGDVTLTLNLAGLTAAQAFGADGAGVDVTLHSATAGDYMMWDASDEKLIIEGTNGATALDVTDGNAVIADGTLSLGGAAAAGWADGNIVLAASVFT